MSDAFPISGDKIMWVFFSLLIWCITLIGFNKMNQPCIPEKTSVNHDTCITFSYIVEFSILLIFYGVFLVFFLTGFCIRVIMASLKNRNVLSHILWKSLSRTGVSFTISGVFFQWKVSWLEISLFIDFQLRINYMNYRALWRICFILGLFYLLSLAVLKCCPKISWEVKSLFSLQVTDYWRKLG